MADLARLGFAVDTAALKTAEDSLTRIAAAGERAGVGLRAISPSAQAAKTATDTYAATVNNAVAAQVALNSVSSQGSTIVSLHEERIRRAAGAHAAMSTQAMALQHAMRGMVEQIALGVPITQALTGQMSHLTYVATGPGGLKAAFDENAKMFKTMASAGIAAIGPVGLIAIGLGAAAAAAVALYAVFREKAPTTEQVLEKHKEQLDVISKAYADAGKAAGEFYNQSKKITELQVSQNLIDLKNQLQTLSSRAVSKYSVMAPSPDMVPLGVPDSAVVSDTREGTTAYKELNAAIIAFNASARDVEAVKALRDGVAAIGIAAAATSPLLAKAANDILNNTKAMADMALAVEKTEASMRLLNGTATTSDRKLLGLNIHPQISAYQQLVQSTEDRIKVLKIEAETVGKASYEADALKLKLEAENAARKSGVAVNETWLKQKQAELEYYERLKAVSQVQSQIDFDRKTVGLSQEDIAIAERLKPIYGNDIPAALSSTQAAQIRVINTAREMHTTFSDAATSLVQGLASGRSVMDSLVQSSQKLVQTLGSQTLQKLQSGGGLAGLFNNNSPNIYQGGMAVGASALSGYQSGSPFGGALSGLLAGAATGNPLIAAGAGIAGLVGGLFGADSQKKAAEEAHQQEVQAAKDAWARMEGQWKEFVGTLTGKNVGSVQSAIDAALQQTKQYNSAIAQANDLKSGSKIPQENNGYVGCSWRLYKSNNNGVRSNVAVNHRQYDQGNRTR